MFVREMTDKEKELALKIALLKKQLFWIDEELRHGELIAQVEGRKKYEDVWSLVLDVRREHIEKRIEELTSELRRLQEEKKKAHREKMKRILKVVK